MTMSTEAVPVPSTDWIAEEVPSYLLDSSYRRPTSDHTAHITATITVTSDVTERAAHQIMALHLESIARLSHVQSFGNPAKYNAAANAFRAGVDAVQISGRVFRVRHAPTPPTPSHTPAP
jgi:hypothetical protein